MMHITWWSVEDVPYQFWGFQSNFNVTRADKLTIESILSKITRPVAAIKSPRFALFKMDVGQYMSFPLGNNLIQCGRWMIYDNTTGI